VALIAKRKSKEQVLEQTNNSRESIMTSEYIQPSKCGAMKHLRTQTQIPNTKQTPTMIWKGKLKQKRLNVRTHFNVVRVLDTDKCWICLR
jgi:predicted secreted protein